jgi:hypothetical protein
MIDATPSITEIQKDPKRSFNYKAVQVLVAVMSDIRTVYVPAEIANDVPNFLENVFKYGQNIFQEAEDMPSVSVGDIIKIEGSGSWPSTYWRVDAVGFSAVEKRDWYKAKSTPPVFPRMVD